MRLMLSLGAAASAVCYDRLLTWLPSAPTDELRSLPLLPPCTLTKLTRVPLEELRFWENSVAGTASLLLRLMMFPFLTALLDGLLSLETATPLWFYILTPIDLLDMRRGDSGEVTLEASVCARDPPVARQLPRFPLSCS